MRIHSLIGPLLTSLCFILSSCKEEKKEHEIQPILTKDEFDTTVYRYSHEYPAHYFQYPDIQRLDTGQQRTDDKYNRADNNKHIYLFKWYDQQTATDKVGYIWVTY